MDKLADVDRYMVGFDAPIRRLLEQVRSTIRKAAPLAEECINYGVPTFKLEGNLVHFAAFKKHIGFYPAPSGIEAFKNELLDYEFAKGSVKFPIDQPLPLDLVSRIVQFRLKENLEKSAKKKTLRTCPKGHNFYKSSDCRVCPTCEAARKPPAGFLATLSAPARRALENKGIVSPEHLAGYTEKEILSLHGMGRSSLPKLQQALKDAKLSFKDQVGK